jgi:hypothetical protein
MFTELLLLITIVKYFTSLVTRVDATIWNKFTQ